MRSNERKRTLFHNMICEIHIFEKVSLINVKIRESERERVKKKKLLFIHFIFSLKTFFIVKFMCETKDYFISLI